jgi:hypothetical protein
MPDPFSDSQKQTSEAPPGTAAEEPEAARKLRVFLCHALGDKPAVRDLYRRLRADGFAPWLDEEDILPGQDWDFEIKNAVCSADVVIVCLSCQSVGKAGYVQKEIRFALDVADRQPEGTIYIIPLRLEACEVPDRLSQWQWVDFFDTGGYEKLLRSLRKRAKKLSTPPGRTPREVAVEVDKGERSIPQVGDESGGEEKTVWPASAGPGGGGPGPAPPPGAPPGPGPIGGEERSEPKPEDRRPWWRALPPVPKRLLITGMAVLLVLLAIASFSLPILRSGAAALFPQPTATPPADKAADTPTPSAQPPPGSAQPAFETEILLPTDTSTASPTSTPAPTPTSTDIPIPPAAPALADAPIPTATPTLTDTPVPTSTSTPAPVPTPVPNTPPPRPTSTYTPIPIPAGEFILTQPVSGVTVSDARVVFEWQWTGSLEEDQGFEVCIRPDNPNTTDADFRGIHNAFDDNTSGALKQPDNIYRLEVGDLGATITCGTFDWTVRLVQITESPVKSAKPLGPQAAPSRLIFRPSGCQAAGSGGSGSTGSGGFVSP